MNEPWYWRDDDDDFEWKPVVNDEERRELNALRRWRDTVLWLLENAGPEAWVKGMRDALADTDSHPSYKIVYHVREAMPRREATEEEGAELQRLIRGTRDPQMWSAAMAQALREPGWYLLMYRRLARDLGVDQDAGVI